MLLFWRKTHHLSHMVSIVSSQSYIVQHGAMWHAVMYSHYHIIIIVDELSRDGTFAGNDAIVAVSRACEVNIVIHQLGAPRWEVLAPVHTDKILHIAYLRGEHYCSVQPLHPAQNLPPLVRRHDIHGCVVQAILPSPSPFSPQAPSACSLWL